MDADHSDAWMRRRFGLAAGGFAALLLGTLPAGSAGRRRRCRNLDRRCNLRRQRRCCSALACGAVAGLSGKHCCKKWVEPCSEEPECCGQLRCIGGMRSVRPEGPVRPVCDVHLNRLRDRRVSPGLVELAHFRHERRTVSREP